MPSHLQPGRLLWGVKSVERMSNKHGCATANQERNNDGHGQSSIGCSPNELPRQLLREMSHSRSRMNCMMQFPVLVNTRRLGAALFRDHVVEAAKWFLRLKKTPPGSKYDVPAVVFAPGP